MQHSLASFPPNRTSGRQNQLEIGSRPNSNSGFSSSYSYAPDPEITRTGTLTGPVNLELRRQQSGDRHRRQPLTSQKVLQNNRPSCFALVIANPPSEHLLRLPFLSTFSRLGLTVAIRRKGRTANLWARLHSEVGFHGKSSHLLSPRNPKRVEDRFNLIQVSRRPE